MTEKCLLVRIEGKVQGVWYRAWTETTACERGLKGWVRNRPDGSVQALFVGPPERVDAMVTNCHEGPPLARVSAVHVEAHDDEAPGGETLDGFEQRPDG